MTKKDYVYLAGPMEDLSESEMKGWRDEVTLAEAWRSPSVFGGSGDR